MSVSNWVLLLVWLLGCLLANEFLKECDDQPDRETWRGLVAFWPIFMVLGFVLWWYWKGADWIARRRPTPSPPEA